MASNRIEDYSKVLPIVEVYLCVQSEGSRAGMPTIAIRTTGCTHRCWFGEGRWCDSWYTSIHPEKGTFTFNDIIDIYDKYPYVKEMMLTGGSPTMHSALVNELTHFAHERGIIITIETEGSHFLATDFPISLISLSPKFNNSIPVLGVKTPSPHNISYINNPLAINVSVVTTHCTGLALLPTLITSSCYLSWFITYLTQKVK